MTDSELLLSLLQLNPQEQYLYWQHLYNLYSNNRVVSPTGDISTLYQTVVSGPGGKYYNIPTVWGGQILTVPEATQRAAAVGWNNWPSYLTPDQADLRYNTMHHTMSSDVDRLLQTHDLSSQILSSVPDER